MATTRSRLFKIRRGDTRPKIQAQLTSAGVPFDLIGVTSVELRLLAQPGHPGTVYAGAPITGNESLSPGSDLPNVEVDWADGDTDINENDYPGYWRVVDGDGKTWSFPEDTLTVRITQA